MTGTVEDESSEPKSDHTRVRVLQAIDKVLKKTLDCNNSSVVAQLCYSISQELAGNSSAHFCNLTSDGTTCSLPKCELCVNTAISSRMARIDLAEDDVAEESCYNAMLKGKCNVPNCIMPCFTLYKDLVLNIIDGLAYHRIIRDENGTAVDLEFIDVNPAFEGITGIKREVAASYDLEVNNYLRKSIDFDQFVECIKQLELYWFVLNITAPFI